MNFEAIAPARRLVLAVLLALALGCGVWAAISLTGAASASLPVYRVPIGLDLEHQLAGRPLNASTQSVNRYHSVLRKLQIVDLTLENDRNKLSLKLRQGESDHEVLLKDIDATFLAPLLPYPLMGHQLDAFDRANLMLAEYARNGVQLSYQASNDNFGVFHDHGQVFDPEGGEEYFFAEGELKPNPLLRPTRIGLTNNCLDPGLWEVSANDSVGEMFHGWLTLPQEAYLDMVRRANGLRVADEDLASALQYRKSLADAPLDLDRLRSEGPLLLREQPRLVRRKELGAYSSQDSRRKVQRGFFRVYRGDQPLPAETFADLTDGDIFKLHAFVQPGVYTPEEQQIIAFDPHWNQVEIFEVQPRTRYPGEHQPSAREFGHVEIKLTSTDGKRLLVAGNVPIALLVPQEDYSIPAFGVGVLAPSELIERRYLRLKEGPVPHYAYLAEKQGGDWRLLNNHELGYEQVFLRPFERQGQPFLRLTLVSYERIVDLLELEIPLRGELAQRLAEASRVYQTPLYRSYRDENIL